MLNTNIYSYSHDFEESDLENMEIERSFRTEQDAIYSIYEQLFDSKEYICEEILLKAMKYLVFKKQMTEQMEEIRKMDVADVCVEHKEQVLKAKQKLTNIKNQLIDLAYLRT